MLNSRHLRKTYDLLQKMSVIRKMKSVASPTPCELAVRVIIPSLRALVAKELIQSHSLKQQEVAAALGVTQSAISQYVRSARGKTLNLIGVATVNRIVKETAETISRDEASAVYINSMYCQACKVIRKNNLMCDLHKRFDPNFNSEGCTACLPSNVMC